jgi:hypothetical protein
MIDDTLLPFDLPAVRRKKLTDDFDGGTQSSDAGLLLLREAERAWCMIRANPLIMMAVQAPFGLGGPAARTRCGSRLSPAGPKRMRSFNWKVRLPATQSVSGKRWPCFLVRVCSSFGGWRAGLCGLALCEPLGLLTSHGWNWLATVDNYARCQIEPLPSLRKVKSSKSFMTTCDTTLPPPYGGGIQHYIR